MGLTMYYRTSNSGVSILSQPWTLAGVSAQSANGVTNTLEFPNVIEHRFLQYKAEFATNISNTSPRLNEVRLDIFTAVTPTFTPTASNTPGTPTATSTTTQTFTPTETPNDTVTPTPSLTPSPTVSPTTCAAKPPKPVLASPAHKSKLKVKKVMVAWNEAPCATKYKLMVKEGSKKGKKFLTKGKLTKLQFKVKKLKPGKKYFWRVRAQNDAGGTTSGWYRFKVKP
jgi:hypothetical protein